MGQSLRLILCGGGTGGHVYPALAVAEAVSELAADGVELLYVGTKSGPEVRLLERTEIPYTIVRAGAIRGRSPYEVAMASKEMTIGFAQARKVIQSFQANVVFITGGYVSVPVALAARTQGVPLVVFLPDVRPGWAVSFVSRLAQRVTTTTERALAYLPAGKSTSTGYPVRPVFWIVDRTQARQRLGIYSEGQVILVAGGSRGARRLNEVIGDNLSHLLTHCTLLHVCGLEDESRLRELSQGLPVELRSRYLLYPYLHDDMPWAMAAADLAVMRSGASVMGELTALGLPAILVPYPYAGGHQKYNAEYLGDAGAAEVLDESGIEELPSRAISLLQNTERRHSMTQASRALARPRAAHDIARIILETAG